MRFAKMFVCGVIALMGSVAVAQQSGDLAPTLAPPAAATNAIPAAPMPSSGLRGTRAITKPDVDAWLDGFMPYALHTADIPGAVVMVVKDGQIVTARGFGYANIAKHTPVDPYRTLFRPGSVSKLVTWTAVMQLVEQGKLDLDRDVNAYLDFKIPPRDGRPITLRQIMTHTAGFEEAAKDTIFSDPKHLMPLDGFLKRWIPRRIYAPGTTPAYSNWATALAGHIVERASGMSFDDYVDQRIFAPLGMRDSTFRQPLPARLVAQMATGYPRASEPASKHFEIVGPAPAGAMTASGIDMARFMIAHLQGGELDGGRILSAETAAAMHDSALNKVNPLSLMPPLNRMELGFFETNINGHQVIGHLGDTQDFHTSLHLFMNDGVGFFVSFNSPGKAGAAGTLRGALFQDFGDRYFGAPQRDGRVDAKTAARHAQMMTGNWVNTRRAASSFLAITELVGQATVTTAENGDLIVSSLTGLGGAPRHWVEIAPFVWRDRDSHERLAAKVIDGEVARWSIDMISPFMAFERVPASLSSAWLMPVLYASLGVLLLTFLYWPGAWYVRRRYGSALSVGGRALQAYRGTRLLAGLALVVLIGWIAALSAMLADINNFTDRFDGWLWLLQVAGLLVFFGAVGFAAWNAWLTWHDGRRWTRKLWSVLILLATLVVLYVAIRFGLMSMTVSY